MIIRCAAVTDQGVTWAEKLGLPVERPASVMAWTKDVFHRADAIVFICAAGIAVRAIAKHIRSKTTDPAVIVMDELGRHIIPILSGHLGGANQLALALAERVGAKPVITTATDLHNLPAIDTWAKEHDCAIQNPEQIKDVSAAVLQRKPVGVMITERTLTPPFPVTLVLRPRTLVLGVGCKRGIGLDVLEMTVLDFLKQNGVSLLSLKGLASIDRKKDEAALVQFADKYNLAFWTYSVDELAALQGIFSHSDYVEKTVGVGNVCERAAVCAAQGRLLAGKTVYGGITLALAGEDNT